MVDVSQLDSRLAGLAKRAAVAETTVLAFRSHLTTSPLRDILRMNPLLLADAIGAPREEMERLAIHATKVGILDMEWSLVCPICGGVHGQPSIAEINKDQHFCLLCRVNADVDLTTQVEILFSMSPGLLQAGRSPFSDRDTYLAYHFSRSAIRSEEAARFLQSSVRSYTSLAVDQTRRITVRGLSPGAELRLLSFDKGASMTITVDQDSPREAEPWVIDAEIFSGTMSPSDVSVRSRTVVVSLRNRAPSRAGILVITRGSTGSARSPEEVMRPGLSVLFRDQFTGAKLLSNQTFRDLYKAQSLPTNLHVKAGDITILFTDLKGSTELYERTGDMTAYSLVQQHFDLLKARVDQHHGALIKTIGDAVMASFTRAGDALEAAIEMVDAIQEMNRETARDGHEIAIKVGLHRGTALAVNANDRLDYFGQAVNIAARVQGLAAGGEIWVTAEIHDDPGCQTILDSAGYAPQLHTAELKGVTRPVPVYRCVAPQAAIQKTRG